LWNLYTYCRNNPITYFDPDGRLEHYTFTLNKKKYSSLDGENASYIAFSGQGIYRNHPARTHYKSLGPIPQGVWYIVDRPTGRLGKFLKFFGVKSDWFALYRKDSNVDDNTFANPMFIKSTVI